MNVYDFDGTIYDGDCSLDFYFFCLCKHPKILMCAPIQIAGMLLYAIRKIDKTRFKEKYFSFLNLLTDVDQEINTFWEGKINRIMPWYLNQRQEDDVVISASPYFLVNPACEMIGVKNVIASDVDKHSGRFNSENCRGNSKVIFFRQKFPGEKIENFYSDSLSDAPMAMQANRAYLIRRGKVVAWPDRNEN